MLFINFPVYYDYEFVLAVLPRVDCSEILLCYYE